MNRCLKCGLTNLAGFSAGYAGLQCQCFTGRIEFIPRMPPTTESHPDERTPMTDDERGEMVEQLMDQLGFCLCGRPEDAAEFIRGGLRLLADLKDKVWEDTETVQSWNSRVEAYFGNDGATYFFWYWLDKEELSEHGGGVPGWLSDTGLALLRDLDAALGESVSPCSPPCAATAAPTGDQA